MTLEGILPIWKPEGYTSHDVVARARRILGLKRIGHTGTLDPQVTGVLPLCIGRATRMVEYIQELPKEYEAVLLIGLSTDTEDATGTILEEADHVELTDEQITRAVTTYIGQIEQVPPMYSAVKMDGKRLYELAREGKEVERRPRQVMIHEIEVTSIDRSAKHPEIHFRVLCSKGTYIRTLCVDIGRTLGYPSTMKHLIRTSTGRIRKEQCMTLEEMERYRVDGTLESRLIPMDAAVFHIPDVQLSEQQSIAALQGKKIALKSILSAETGLYRVYSPDGRFLGIFEWNQALQNLQPVKVFL